MSGTRLADAVRHKYSPLHSPRAIRDEIACYTQRERADRALDWVDEQYQRLFMFAAEESRRAQDATDRVRLADHEFLIAQAPMPFAGSCVYTLHDHVDALLYIGQTSNVWKRIGAHATKPWGRRIASVRVIRCASQAAALELEARMIWELNPTYNVQHRCSIARVSA